MVEIPITIVRLEGGPADGAEIPTPERTPFLNVPVLAAYKRVDGTSRYEFDGFRFMPGQKAALNLKETDDGSSDADEGLEDSSQDRPDV